MNDRLELLKEIGGKQSARDVAWEEYFGQEPKSQWFDDAVDKPLTEKVRGAHPDIQREAVRRELRDRRLRATSGQGHGLEKYRLLGKRAGLRAKSADDAQKHLKVLNPPQVRAFIRGFTEAFAEAQGIRDSDVIAMTGFDQYLKYKQLDKQGRSDELADKVQQIEESDFERGQVLGRAQWKRDVRRLSASNGLSEAYISAYLIAYGKEQARRRLPLNMAVFDPKRLPQFRLGGQLLLPLAKGVHEFLLWAQSSIVVRFAKDLIPGTGVLEAILGQDLITGERLSAFDRGLGAVLDLLPFAGKALRGGKAVLKAGHKLSKASLEGAEALAVSAILAGMEPHAFLRAMKNVSKLSRDKLGKLKRRVSAKRKQRGYKASKGDTRVARQVDEALGPMAAPSRTARSFDVASLPQEAQALIRQKGLTKVYQRYGSKLGHDADTIKEVEALIKLTKGNNFTYQTSRAAAGELAVLEKLYRNPNVQQIRMAPTSNVRGSRTPDFVVDVADGSGQVRSLQVEVTSVTLSKRVNRRAQKQPERGQDIPAAERGRRAREHDTRRDFDTTKVKAAIIRKIDRGQVENGVIAVVIPNKGSLASVLTDAERLAVQTALEGANNIREVWVIYQRAGRRVIERIDLNPGDLGVATRLE